ncbi:hypothetical protein ACFE04_024327 [Oxalis oulophora]
MFSKTLVEEAAWEFAKENGIDLVTINSGSAIGAMLQPTLNGTVEMFLNIINDLKQNNHYAFVDVRDVACAHILAFEVPSAKGRYTLVRTGICASILIKMVCEKYHTLKLPKKCSDGDPILPIMYQVATQKAERLGVNFIHFEVSLKRYN